MIDEMKEAGLYDQLGEMIDEMMEEGLHDQIAERISALLGGDEQPDDFCAVPAHVPKAKKKNNKKRKRR